METKEAQAILRKNKVNALRDFAMMMKEEKFQQFLGHLVTYRRIHGSEEFNLKLWDMYQLIKEDTNEEKKELNVANDSSEQ